jgi:hypothetical protein
MATLASATPNLGANTAATATSVLVGEMANVVYDAARANATAMKQLLNDANEYVDWKHDPLRYFWATFCACSCFMWFGFAGDNLQYYRMNGGLAYAGGATARSVTAESFGKSGMFLLMYRLCALCACGAYVGRFGSSPITKNEGTGTYALNMSEFLNLHDWTLYAVTTFFLLATSASVLAMCSTPGTLDRYLGHSGRCNTLGHWVMALYTVAFTMSVVFTITVIFEAIFSPQCVPSSARGEWSTLTSPDSRLCYLEPQYMLGYIGTVVLMLFEASVGRLVFPKCYMSQPIFYCSAFFIMNHYNVLCLQGDWSYGWTNFLRKQTIFYLNAFMTLVMVVFYGLVKFLRSNANTASAKQLEERVPLFM